MKIGILTYHRARNYGAFLQAFCLCARLNNEEDIEAEIIDYDMESAKRHYSYDNWSLRKKILNHSAYKFITEESKAFERGYTKLNGMKSNGYLCSDDIDQFIEFVKGKYDVIIAGSDEIWKIKEIRPFPNPYFLPGNLGCRKFSYAASARMDFDSLSEKDHIMLTNCLKEFEFISVRDNLTYISVKAEGIPDEKIVVSCDPSFLYDFPYEDIDIQNVLKGKCRLDNKKKTIVLAKVRQDIADMIIDQIGAKYNIVSVFSRVNGCKNIADLDPFEWRELIASADFIITTLFHGVCFSIVNNTPFLGIGLKNKKSKMVELLKNTELEENYVDENLARGINWSELVDKKTANPVNYRNFVLNERSEFQIFLDAVRNKDVSKEVCACKPSIINHPRTYAVKNNDEQIRMESRSGGVFSALSEYVLKQNGVVYGCVLNNKFNAVHYRATTKEECARMRGSKYVQSVLGDTFANVKKDIDEGKLVLFSGTPCQVAGLKRFIGGNHESLILIDILCHGVPSPLVWNQYLRWQEGRFGCCRKVNFRNKVDFGWNSHVETLSFDNGKIVNSRVFSYLFNNNYIFRPSCYDCQYKKEEHPSDITLGDYWEIDKVLPEFNDNKGVSLVYVNSAKGEHIFNLSKSNLLVRDTKYEYSVRDSMFASVKKPTDRDEFWEDFHSVKFSKVIKKFDKNSFSYRIKNLIKKMK